MPPLIVVCLALLAEVHSLKVLTSQGVILGLDVQTAYGRVASFLGVPYAQPPVGPLRFEAPRAPLFSTEVYNATFKKFSCPSIESNIDDVLQLDFGEQNEDCLYLNLWAPVNASKLPVVLYIHGGSFVTGSGNHFAFDGTRLAARINAIYITINMRLGPFGFMRIPGLAETNVGLQDIVEALRWIRSNVAAFGGDVQQITLWGQSAGAIAIDFLLKSNSLDGLVRRAVLQGGSAGTAKALLNADGQYACQQLAYALGCFGNRSKSISTQAAVSCVRNRTSEDIISTLSEGNALQKASIQPFVDNRLLRDDVVSSGRIAPAVKDVFILNDEQEGLMFIKVLFKKLYQTKNILTIDWLTSLMVMFKLTLRIPYRTTSELIRRYMSDEFVDDDSNDDPNDDSKEIQLQQHIAQMFTDSIFLCPAENRAETASENGVRVYRGEFHFRPGFSILPPWASMSHAEEIPYLHANLDLYKPGVKGLSDLMLNAFKDTNQNDWEFSDQMIELLKEFFHTG